MAIRPTMAALIAWTRDLIGDLATNTTQQFSDQQVQDRLDNRRADVRYEQLAAGPTIVQDAANGSRPVVLWADYYSAYKHWESDVVLQGNTPGVGSWLVLSAADSDYITGRFRFSLNPFTTDVAPVQFPPVWATGKVYDVYASAADLVQMWRASLTVTTFDFTSGAGASFRAGQIITNLMQLEKDLRAQAWITPIEVYRTDLRPTDDVSLIVDPNLKTIP